MDAKYLERFKLIVLDMPTIKLKYLWKKEKEERKKERGKEKEFAYQAFEIFNFNNNERFDPFGIRIEKKLCEKFPLERNCPASVKY